MTGAESAEVAASIVNAGAALVIAGAALWGLTAWKRELTGKRRAELAEDTLVLFYEARSNLNDARQCRPPMQSEALVPEQKDISNKDFYPPRDLLRQQSKFWARFFAARFRFAAVFGKEHEKHFGEIYGCRTRVMQAANVLSSGAKISHELWQELWDAVFDHGDNDQIRAKVNNAIEAIEPVCRTAIKARAR
jgi:hypothetical protein